MKALGFGLALMLVATTAWSQDQQPPATDAFRVSWQQETDPVTRRIEGHVHNDSQFRVTDVRLQVEGLDAGSRSVGRTYAWALGDIAPGEDTSFVTEAVPGAVTYQINVISYDVVSGPMARESR
jgi:hypothetical protein